MELVEAIYQNIVIFSHRDNEGNERVWNITSLMNDPRVQRHTIRKIPIDPRYAMAAMKQFGVEKDHLYHLWDKEITDPILMAVMVKKDYIMIDGNHRYVLRAIKEKKWIYAKLISAKIWKDHLITGISKAQMDRLVDQNSSYMVEEDIFYNEEE